MDNLLTMDSAPAMCDAPAMDNVSTMDNVPTMVNVPAMGSVATTDNVSTMNNRPIESNYVDAANGTTARPTRPVYRQNIIVRPTSPPQIFKHSRSPDPILQPSAQKRHPTNQNIPNRG